MTEVDFNLPVRTITHVEYLYGADKKEEICQAVRSIPEGKFGGGGRAFIALVQEVARIYKCNDRTAYNIVEEAHLIVGKRKAIASPASYRNTKAKFQ